MHSTLFVSCLRIILVCGVGFSGCAVHPAAGLGNRTPPRPERVVAVLNLLRNEITARYGFRDGAPRVNLGPCGRVARDFRERWNARFRDQATIVFIMSDGGRTCNHVLIKLPDGRYFDGGNGVVTASFLATLYPGSRIEEMKTFDLKLLDRRSYGLGRDYPECTNYSDEFTRKVIDRRLDELAGHSWL